ncbi:enoyl-hydratase isomerase family protein [Stylonychia lemnae]|uniref:Enoyl-hydratase isomerase family protein n=1 Tax=Stylonychia lemnae TaxID=5949 RepID=A0A078AKU1_STYLE|nr:enoyl-hydratase isomerase family protein [Stylonychia lemnae]|eukprot:CDW81418.1 enoyl-hydratase isomerase family protein [Stylonychia lemnae]
MYNELKESLQLAQKLDEVKVVLVYGAQGDFSSGNDMDNFINLPPDSAQNISDFTFAFAGLTKPLYFFVQGCAVGIIATMAAHADFVYCSENAFFFTPFMGLQLATEGLCSIKFPEIMGRRKAAEVLFLDQRVTAQDALKYRFINGIIKRDDLPATEPLIQDIEKLPYLKKLLSTDSKTMQNAKKLLVQGQDMQRLRQHNMLEQTLCENAQLAPGFKDHIRNYMKKGMKKEQPKL